MQLISAIPSYWKNTIKQNNNINMFATKQYRFIQTVQKVTVQNMAKEGSHEKIAQGYGVS